MGGIHVYVTLKGKRKEFGDSVGGCKLSMACSLLFVPKRRVLLVLLHDGAQPSRERAGLDAALVPAHRRGRLATLRAADEHRAAHQARHARPLGAHLRVGACRRCVDSERATPPTSPGAATLRLDDAHTVVDMRRAMKEAHLRGFTKMVYAAPRGGDLVAVDTLMRHAQLAKLAPNLLLVELPNGYVDKTDARKL